MDESALVDALQKKHIKGALVEVFEKEPLPADSPFYGLENCVVAAHCADNSADHLAPTLAGIEENVARFCAGEALLNPVDKAEGY